MFSILKKEQLSETVYRLRVLAPQMAKKAQAGQFLMVRISSTGERLPFTFANWDESEGWIEFIFMVCGKSTRELAGLEVGDALLDVVGPLGNPTEIKPGRWCVIGGGVGLAIALPVAKHLLDTGHDVTAIMGARNNDLLILQKEFEKLPLKELYKTTDDGSTGEKGVVTTPLKHLLDAAEIDHIFCVGPVPMMKFCALTAQDFDVTITASLNPIMVDGTGMCGCCRVEIGGCTKFACVDGPDFDARKVDWDDLMTRQRTYKTEEKQALDAFEGGCSCHK